MRELDQSALREISGGFITTPFLWGSVLGAVGYVVGNKKDLYLNGFAIAVIGGGTTAFLGSYGVLGKVLQVITVAVTAETIDYIQEKNEYVPITAYSGFF